MNILVEVQAAVDEPFLSHIKTSFYLFACKNRNSDYKTGNIGRIAADKLVVDVLVASLLTTNVSLVVDRLFYQIFRLVFVFSYIKSYFWLSN